MTTQRTINKSLAGEEDLELGEGVASQTRAGVNYDITRIGLVKFLTDPLDLVGLDTTKFTKANVYDADGGVTHYQYIDPDWVITPYRGTSTVEAVSDASSIEFDADATELVRYTGTATALTGTQTWTMKAGAGQYAGQHFKLLIHGSIPTGGNNVVVFGRTFSPASNEMQGLTVEGVFDGTWTYSYSDLI